MERSPPSPSDDMRPKTLSDCSISAVADLIKAGRAKKIVVMTGAGISTAAGIPDFRSPKTGLYHNLARLNLPHPEAVFEMDFFRFNPYPFYILAKELYPANFQPTVSHAFVSLLAEKGLLRMLFTQNIDCLERKAGVPSELIVEAHGSFATQRCIECRTPFPDEDMRKCVEQGNVAFCIREECGGFVKPDIVFFGEGLPYSFFENVMVPLEADLIIVIGTSLTVYPFAKLPRLAQYGVPRVLFNMDAVGDFGERGDDVLCLGSCDAGIRQLADELGWRDELEKLWVDKVGEEEAARQRARNEHEREQALHALDDLAQDMEQKLELSDDQDGRDSGAIANDPLQDQKKDERPTAIPTTASPERADGQTLATEEEVSPEQQERDVEVEKADEDAPFKPSSHDNERAEAAPKSDKEEDRGIEQPALDKPVQSEVGQVDEKPGKTSEAVGDGNGSKPASDQNKE